MNRRQQRELMVTRRQQRELIWIDVKCFEVGRRCRMAIVLWMGGLLGELEIGPGALEVEAERPTLAWRARAVVGTEPCCHSGERAPEPQAA